MPRQNSKTQNGTDQFRAIPGGTWKEFFGKTARNAEFGSPMPERARTWGEFGAGILKKSGVTSALLGGGLAFQEAVMPERRADAGIVLTFSDVAPAEARGASATVSQGGNLVAVRRTDSTGAVDYASGVAINRNGIGGVYIAGHYGFDRLAFNPTFDILTGPNFNTSPGMIYAANSLTLAPGYAGSATLGSAMDIGFLRLDREIQGAGVISFPVAPLANGEQVELAGFGALGIQNDRLYGQTGNAMAGYSVNFGSSPLLGASRELTTRVDLDDSISGAMREANGGSGGAAFKRQIDNSWLLYGINGQASTSIFATGTQYARTDTETFRSFDNSNYLTAVPEPNSFLMVASLPFIYLANRLRRSLRKA